MSFIIDMINQLPTRPPPNKDLAVFPTQSPLRASDLGRIILELTDSNNQDYNPFQPPSFEIEDDSDAGYGSDSDDSDTESEVDEDQGDFVERKTPTFGNMSTRDLALLLFRVSAEEDETVARFVKHLRSTPVPQSTAAANFMVATEKLESYMTDLASCQAEILAAVGSVWCPLPKKAIQRVQKLQARIESMQKEVQTHSSTRVAEVIQQEKEELIILNNLNDEFSGENDDQAILYLYRLVVEPLIAICKSTVDMGLKFHQEFPEIDIEDQYDIFEDYQTIERVLSRGCSPFSQAQDDGDEDDEDNDSPAAPETVDQKVFLATEASSALDLLFNAYEDEVLSLISYMECRINDLSEPEKNIESIVEIKNFVSRNLAESDLVQHEAIQIFLNCHACHSIASEILYEEDRAAQLKHGSESGEDNNSDSDSDEDDGEFKAKCAIR